MKKFRLKLMDEAIEDNLPIDKIAKEYDNGISLIKLAEKYGVNPYALHKKIINKKNLIRNKKEHFNLPIDKIIKDYKMGMSTEKIANKYYVTPSTIAKRLKDAGIKLRNSSEGKFDLSYIDLPIDEIVKEYTNGMTIQKLAKKYEVSSETIRQRLISKGIVRRKLNNTITRSQIDLPIDQIIEDYNNGMTMEKLAEKYEVAESSIRLRLVQENVNIRHGGIYKRKYNLPIDQIIEEYNNGISLTELSKKYGASPDLIRIRLKEKGITKK
jgi:uncharacterized protein YjcR